MCWVRTPTHPPTPPHRVCICEQKTTSPEEVGRATGELCTAMSKVKLERMNGLTPPYTDLFRAHWAMSRDAFYAVRAGGGSTPSGCSNRVQGWGSAIWAHGALWGAWGTWGAINSARLIVHLSQPLWVWDLA